MRGEGALAHSLLDSSLISTNKNQIYNVKIIDLGKYKQIYFFKNLKIKKDKNKENMEEDYLFKKENIKRKKEEKVIEFKNVMRSTFKCQRLIKANEEEFKTFITLTFEENLTDIEQSNKIWKNFRDSIKMYLKRYNKKNNTNREFKFVCVPEFQKRGAVHYHFLCNLDIKNDSDLIIPQKNKRNCFDIKYWKKGYSSVFSMKDINVVGYLTKYMTKDIDNRLFGKRRYLNSTNLKQPVEGYLNANDSQELLRCLVSLNGFEVKYKNTYCDIFGEEIEFFEYKEVNIIEND